MSHRIRAVYLLPLALLTACGAVPTVDESPIPVQVVAEIPPWTLDEIMTPWALQAAIEAGWTRDDLWALAPKYSEPIGFWIVWTIGEDYIFTENARIYFVAPIDVEGESSLAVLYGPQPVDPPNRPWRLAVFDQQLNELTEIELPLSGLDVEALWDVVYVELEVVEQSIQLDLDMRHAGSGEPCDVWHNWRLSLVGAELVVIDQGSSRGYCPHLGD